MAPSSENVLGDNDDEEITPLSSREMSQISLPSIGEIYEGALEEEGVIEGPIEIRDPQRRLSVGSNSNFSIDSDDDMSHMTTDSKKRRSRKARSKTNRKSSKRKGTTSSSGPSYAELDVDTVNRLLEEKDIVVSSLVKQVEELQQQLLENKRIEESDHVGSEKDLAEELIKAKRLLAEKEIVTESLIEQSKIRQNQIDEKTAAIEEQNREIARLKAKLGSSSNTSFNNNNNNNNNNNSAGNNGDGDSKTKKLERKSSSKKDKKRSSKQTSSRKLRASDSVEITPTKNRRSLSKPE